MSSDAAVLQLVNVNQSKLALKTCPIVGSTRLVQQKIPRYVRMLTKIAVVVIRVLKFVWNYVCQYDISFLQIWAPITDPELQCQFTAKILNLVQVERNTPDRTERWGCMQSRRSRCLPLFRKWTSDRGLFPWISVIGIGDYYVTYLLQVRSCSIYINLAICGTSLSIRSAQSIGSPLVFRYAHAHTTFFVRMRRNKLCFETSHHLKLPTGLFYFVQTARFKGFKLTFWKLPDTCPDRTNPRRTCTIWYKLYCSLLAPTSISYQHGTMVQYRFFCRP